MQQNKFLKGMKNALPIGLGYLFVSFSIGIACNNAGLNIFQSFLISLLNNASAGEYAGLTVIAADAGIAEMIIIMLVVNARYMLMSTALSQRLREDMPIWQRLIIGFDITDEMFGFAYSGDSYLSFLYFLGGMLVTIPAWFGGTIIGAVLGNLMSARLVSGFSVMLFGMFIAIIIPAGKKDKVVLFTVLIGFALSYAFKVLPVLKALSSGTATIILTVAISAVAAILFPKDGANE